MNLLLRRPLLLLTSTVASTCVSTAYAQTPSTTATAQSDWQIAVGAGVVSAPRFIGAKDQRTLVVPTVDVRYQDWFFANPVEGVGVKRDFFGVETSAALTLDLNSRDTSKVRAFSKLPKVQAAPALRWGSAYNLGDVSLSAAIVTRIGDQKERGTTLEFDAGYNLFASKSLLVTAGGAVTLADSQFARNLLSISAADATRAGLRPFQAGSGIYRTALYAQSVYRVNTEWTVFTRLQASRLEGDVVKSPITQRRVQPALTVFATYQWK